MRTDRAAAALLLVLGVAGCSADEPVAPGALPATRATQPAPAPLSTRAQPGHVLLARAAGSMSRTVPLSEAPAGRVVLEHSCAGAGSMRVQVGDTVSTAACDGQRHGDDTPVAGSPRRVQVTVTDGAAWVLRVETPVPRCSASCPPSPRRTSARL